MKKIVATLLTFVLVFSLLLTIPVYATESVRIGSDEIELTDEVLETIRKNYIKTDGTPATDQEVMTNIFIGFVELYRRGIITIDDIERAFDALAEGGDDSITSKEPIQTEYSFGKGTFVVGIDLRPGTYDVVCTASDNEGYSGAMGSLGDIYSGLGMDDFAGLFDSYSGISENLESMYFTIYDKNGIYDNMYTIKVGESARVILEDGMKIEIDGGSVKLTFIR